MGVWVGRGGPQLPQRSYKDRRKDAFEHAKGKKPIISKKPKPKGMRATAERMGVTCGAKKRGGGHCRMAAGWGTNHPGIGVCKLHGGIVPQHVKAAAKQELRHLLGEEKEMNPFEAIMWCIRIRAGEVEWLSQKMGQLEEKDWVEDTLVGKQFTLFARERQAAMQDLVRFSQIAISMGIAERYVRLAEVYGHTIAKLIESVLNDEEMALTPEQKAVAPRVIRRQLLAIKTAETNDDIIEVSAKELPEKAA
jgi:hypothetical protein